jgi:hypothetical protein
LLIPIPNKKISISMTKTPHPNLSLGERKEEGEHLDHWNLFVIGFL